MKSILKDNEKCKVKKKDRFFFSFVLNILFLAICYSLFYCTFESNDDYYMKMIASGAYGTPDIHLVYINSIIGFILRYLYIVMPGVSWYEIIQYILACLALTVIGYVFFERIHEERFLYIPVFLLLFISAYTLYVEFQFTKTASILTLAGYLLISDSIERDKSNKWIILSCLLLLFGFYIRIYQFFACSFVCIPLFLPIVVDYFANGRKDNRKLKKLIISGLCCAALIGVSILIEQHNYSSQDWRDYLYYNYRSNILMDEGFPNYEENEKMYQSVSISREDYDMYIRWNYDDSDKYSLDTIEKIVSARKPRSISANTLATFVISFISYFFHFRRILVYSIVLCGVLVVSLFNQTKGEYKYILLTLANLIICIFYCYYIRIDNLFVYRVHCSFLLISTFIVLYYCRLKNAKIERYTIILSTLLCVLFFCFTRVSNWRILNTDHESDYRKGLLQEINRDSGHLYLRSEDDSIFFLNRQFETETYLSCSNLLHLGGWMANAPLELQIKERYGIRNAYKDCIDNNKVYILSKGDKDINAITDYIKRNYNEKATAVQIKEFANSAYRAYQIRTDADRK